MTGYASLMSIKQMSSTTDEDNEQPEGRSDRTTMPAFQASGGDMGDP